jgi:hypothetical protein
MELVLRVVDGRRGPSIVVSWLAFTKVVCLDLSRIRAEVIARPFPVDFIQVVRHHDRARYDTGTRRHLHDHLDLAEENVEPSPDVWSVVPLGEGEIRAVRGGVSDSGIVGKDPVWRSGGLLCEVHRVGVAGQPRDYRTC